MRCNARCVAIAVRRSSSVMREYRFEIASRLEGRTQEEVWQRISSWDGVNHELGPILRMTFPARYSSLVDIPADGRSHFTSIFLFLGWIPFDAHRFTLQELSVPAFFQELSSNLLMRSWSHRRSVTPQPNGDGVEVRDECGFECRVPLLGALLLRLYKAVFRRRHRRLRAFYANAPASGG